MFIAQNAISWRTPALNDQAQLFALLTRDLIRTYEQQRSINPKGFFELSDYRKFVVSTYAYGFVCKDSFQMEGRLFEQMKYRPCEHFSDCQFRVLRHRVHMLLRAEPSADGWSSPVQDALDSGALGLVATRLESDQNLREPIAVKECDGKCIAI